ncbi:flagellar hook-basal body protein [Chitinimonas sp. PSY-7]|uniref:flagellar hook-basal body complex protein n=1 Tax=Chitinimonas sp. PSY-7 TaxID=3459088 RepID=UPI00403FD300
MSDAISISIQSLQNDMRKLETVSHNLSNATTAGYRRQTSAVTSFATVFDSEQLSLAEPTAAIGSYRTDMRAGPLQVTGRPLDLAIQGEAFFVVNTAQGPAYTRRGDFQIAADGRLVTASGEPVLGTQGELYLEPGEHRVDATGQISVNGNVVGQLLLVEPDKHTSLQALGNAQYSGLEGVQQSNELRSTVKTGFVESSNVLPMQEMVTLMETMRHFEASQRLIQGYDDALGRAIQKLGEV